jgi:peptide/nickel transport system substrate-binding protein
MDCSKLIVIFVALLGMAFAYNEAPMLAQRVAAGDLPPLEERLPVNPKVVPVVERIGDYGGTWRNALVASIDTTHLTRSIGYENLVRWLPDASGIIPNLAESFEANDAGTVFTFHLREGTRWSDGHPFTADDIMFWYEDVVLNDELSPAKPAWLRSGGELGVVEKVDDYTVTFSFTEPHGFFLTFLAMAEGLPVANYPRHYLEQFHAAYNENIDQLVRQHNFDTWTQLFADRAAWAENSARPVLFAWRPTIAVGESTTQFVAERNPFYWKVDEEGNQLPYIDRVVFDIIADHEVALLRALNGEMSMPFRVTNAENRAVFFDYQERGNFRFIEMMPANMNHAILSLNLAIEDPVKNAVFNNRDFRVGLSHAINRQEIIDLVLIGQGEPWQAAPYPSSPIFDEALAKQYTEFNLELANEYFARAGLIERDAQGFLLGPDGNRLTILLEASSHHRTRLDIAEILVQQLQDAGIDMQLRALERSFAQERKESNLYEATIWTGQGGLTPLLNPNHYVPVEIGFSDMAIAWAQWYHGDPRGIEPPDDVKAHMALYDQIKMTPGEEEQNELGRELLRISREMFYSIGIASIAPDYQIIQNNFRNVPDSIPDAWTFLTPGIANPAQFFVENGGN